MESIDINYANGKNGSVRKITVVESLLMDENILLVGEGDFTFTVALAAIRESWRGIISTRFEKVTLSDPRPQFDEVQKECIKFCRSNGKLLHIDDDTIQKYVDAVERVDPPPTNENWLFGIDATNTPENLNIKESQMVVLFQCPWLPSGDPNGTPATLITKFLEHMSTKQNVGDYVLIGITKQFPYVKNYKLGDLLGEDLTNQTDSSDMYNFLGADDTFIKKILKHGYHHTSCHSNTSIHEKIISDHVTLVFQRNDVSSSESSSTSEDNS